MELSKWITEEAGRVGFDACGIAKATALDEESAHVEQWLEGKREGEMGYLTRNKEKRYDPRLLVEGTKSIVTMRQLLARIETQTGKLEGVRIFVDSAPVLDRAWAVRCGLGFIGKNTSLIHPKKGSFFFIGHLFLPLELEETGKTMTNHCGRCTKCLDACPTGALEAPFHIDARKCISYLTIEYKGSLAGIDPKTFKGWMYGCDICQDVCPYNRFALPNIEPEFQPSEQLLSMKESDWGKLNQADFESLFKHSAVKRAGYEGLKRNIEFLS